MLDHICATLHLITPSKPFDKRASKVFRRIYLGAHHHLLVRSATCNGKGHTNDIDSGDLFPGKSVLLYSACFLCRSWEQRDLWPSRFSRSLKLALYSRASYWKRHRNNHHRQSCESIHQSFCLVCLSRVLIEQNWSQISNYFSGYYRHLLNSYVCGFGMF